MTKYKINKELEVICEWKKTRVAFKHVATLLRSGVEVDSVKICYQNRTWEKYEYDSVLEKLANKTGVKAISEFVKNRTSDSGTDALKIVSGIALLGNIFGKTIEEKNDWKKRMLVAGLSNEGLIMPDDFDSLPEDVKQTRLDGAIEQILNR